MKKMLTAFACLAFILSAGCKRPPAALFLFQENGMYGFIDSLGKVVIPAKFNVAEEFSDGLAAVREGGYYGYIDTEGKWIIHPAFDYAMSFSQGVALVYKGNKASFIRRDGKELFKMNYAAVEPFQNGRAIVSSWNKHFGVIETSGRLVLDTIYREISAMDGGHFVLVLSNDSACIVNRTGHQVLPYGSYYNIMPVGEGHFLLNLFDTSHCQPAAMLIDAAGKELFKISSKDLMIEPVMFDSVLTYSRWPEGQKTVRGIISSKGRIIYADSTINRLGPFYGNRSFIMKDFKCQVITIDGKIIGPYFDGYLQEGFRNNVAFVEKGFRWGMIDTNANYIIPPRFDQIMEPGLIGDVFFFQRLATASSKAKFGIADKNGKIILLPRLDNYDTGGFKNGLLRCLLDNRLTYINRAGKIVWQEKAGSAFRAMNIDYMQRGYCYVKEQPELRWSSGNELLPLPQKISPVHKLPADGFGLQVVSNSKDTFDTRYKGWSVLIYNSSSKPVEFDAQDARLYMNQQAFVDNEWKDIEYLPSSWCGNSYHTVTLPSKNYWQLKCPVYEGGIKTKLRIKLVYRKDKDGSDTLYSNEFQGGINPGQLWRKEGYRPQNLMDPYVD